MFRDSIKHFDLGICPLTKAKQWSPERLINILGYCLADGIIKPDAGKLRLSKSFLLLQVGIPLAEL